MDIQPADPRLRRTTAIVLTVATLLACTLLVALQYWLDRAFVATPNAQMIVQLRTWTAASMTAVGVCLLVLAGYAARLARQTSDGMRWPPETLRMLRDTPIRRGETAQRIARALNIGALTLVVLGIGAAWFGWRLFAQGV